MSDYGSDASAGDAAYPSEDDFAGAFDADGGAGEDDGELAGSFGVFDRLSVVLPQASAAEVLHRQSAFDFAAHLRRLFPDRLSDVFFFFFFYLARQSNQVEPTSCC